MHVILMYTARTQPGRNIQSKARFTKRIFLLGGIKSVIQTTCNQETMFTQGRIHQECGSRCNILYRDWFLSACASIPTARKWGVIIQDALMKLVTIKVGVVSSFAQLQRKSAFLYSARALELNSRHAFCAMICVLRCHTRIFFLTEAYAVNKEA